MRTMFLSAAIGLLIISTAIASDTSGIPTPSACNEVQTCGSPDCCAHCGGNACCEKYCRVVCEMKEVKKTVWVVKCENFCPPLPRCGRQCDECCESCGKETCGLEDCKSCCKKCDPCAALEQRNYVPPKCGKVRMKKTLEKKEVICKIPTFKCVVVYACANCGSKCRANMTQPQAPLPPSPAPAAPEPKSTKTIPLPPVLGASFAK